MKSNLVLSILSAAAKIIGSIGLISILARVFSLADFGDFTYTLTLATVFSLLVDYGYNIKIIKDVALKKESNSLIASKAIFGKLLLFLITCLIFTIVSRVLNNQTTILYTSFLLLLSLICFSFTNVVLSIFKGEKEYASELKIVVLDNLLTCILVSIVAYFTRSLLLTAFSFFISKLIALFIAILIYSKSNKIIKPSFLQIKQDLFQALPYAVHYWVGSFYLNVDTILMEGVVTSEQIGLYQAGIRIVLGFGIILTVINAIFIPLLSDALKKEKKIFEQISVKLNNNVIRLAIAVSIGLILCSRPIILILFGSKFLPLTPIIWIFALIIGLRIVGSSYGVLLTISNKQRIRAIAGAISIVLIIICDSWLIPIYGYEAAAYVLLLAHIFINIFYILSVYFEYKCFFLPSMKQFFDTKNIL